MKQREYEKSLEGLEEWELDQWKTWQELSDWERQDYYLILDQLIVLLESVKESATVLFQYYYGVCADKTFEITDYKTPAKKLGWPVKKVKDNKEILLQQGWISDIQYYSQKKDCSDVRIVRLGKAPIRQLTQIIVAQGTLDIEEEIYPHEIEEY